MTLWLLNSKQLGNTWEARRLCDNLDTLALAFFPAQPCDIRELNSVFSLPWLISMFFSQNKRTCLHNNRVQFQGGLLGDTNIVAIPLFRDTNMAAWASRESLRKDDCNSNDNATNKWFDWLNEEKESCGTLSGAIIWRCLPNADVKCSYLRLWRQLEPSAVNLSFSSAYMKTNYDNKVKGHFTYFVQKTNIK